MSLRTAISRRRNHSQSQSQSQSQDSLLLHMSRDNNHDDNETMSKSSAAAAAAAVTNATETSSNKAVADLWQTVDRELRLNIGNSLKCGICLSTLQEPVRTPCVHAYCKDCLLASLMSGNKKCPECNTSITKRSLQPFEYLQDLCDAYKSSLREFGMVPTKYTPQFTTMTQKVCSPSSPSSSCSSSSQEVKDEDELSPQDQLDRLDVATAWQQKALPLLYAKNKIQELQVTENNQVVEANFKACQSFLVHKSQLNSTQEVLEQAREQQWADEAWKQREEEEKRKEQQAKGHPPPSQESSIVLTAPEESQTSSSSNKRVSFSAKPPASHLLESSTARNNRNNLAVHTSHASEDTEIPAEEDIITPKLTNVTFSNKAATTPAKVVAASKPESTTTSPLFESSLSPIDVQASQELVVPMVVVGPSSSSSNDHDDDNDEQVVVVGEESELTLEPTTLLLQTSDTNAPPNTESNKATKTKKKKGKGKSNNKATASDKENAKSSNTQQQQENSTASSTSSSRKSSRRSQRRKDEPPPVEESLSMPTPSPTTNEDDNDNDEIMSHNDTEESEEQFPILEQGTQMTQDDGNNDDNLDATAKAMMEDSFGALHLLPPKRRKQKKTNQEKDELLVLSQSSQVSDEEEDGGTAIGGGDQDNNHNTMTNENVEEDQKKSSQTALEESFDDDCTVPIIKSQSSPDASIRTQESPTTAAAAAAAAKPHQVTRKKRTSFGTATTTRFGAAVSQVMEETTIQLNQEDDDEGNDDRKPAARPTITPRPRRRRKIRTPTSEHTADEGLQQNTENVDEEEQTIENNNEVPVTPAPATRPRVWNVGEIVKVQSRTWPGVNKLGGVARISKVWETNANGGNYYSYDVQYILGGKESKVDAIFVLASDDFDEESKPQQRRRRRADVTELPMSVLQALDQDGFDTTGLAPLKTPYVQRKRPRLAPQSARKDGTNNANNNKEAKKTTSTKKAPPLLALKDSTNNKNNNKKETKKTTNAKKATSTKNKRKADSNNAQETKAITKKVTKKAKENPKSESKSKEAAKSKGAPSKTAEAKAKAAAAKKKGMISIASMSLPEIFVKADDHYESIMDSVQRDEELYIVTSSLKEADMSLLKEVCSKSIGNMRLRLTETFSKRTKVCVLPVVESEGNIRPQIRTVKAVRSALAGIPMVSPDWIAQMKKEKKFVTPKTFVRSLTAKAVPGKKGGVAQYAAGVKSKQNLILKGTAVFLCGSFPDAQRKDMQLVAKEAGALVLKTPQQAVDQLQQQSKRVVVLCQNSNITPATLEKQLRTSLTANPRAALVVGPGWLFDSIASVEELPPHAFPPLEGKQRKAVELWKLCCNDR